MKNPAQSASKRLLLIEDDPNLVFLMRDLLEFQGYTVTTAENGRVALEILQADIPDMIICDVMMPEMDGYSLVERVRQDPRIAWIPIMFLSAKGQSHDRVKGLNQGADFYMVKPFEPEELFAQVEAALNQSHRSRNQSKLFNIDESSRIQVPSNVELTPTELKVVELVSQGMSNKDIAEKLSVSQRTVESHVSNMLNKTNLNNRTELTRWAIESRRAH
jgi:DNA-binding NarL/FixJ family response regulator